MLGVDSRCLVRLVGEPISSTRLEQAVVGIEHLPCQDLEPLASDTTSIDTFLVIEAYAELAILHLIPGLALEILETVLKHALTPNVELQGTVVLSGVRTTVKLLVEVVALVVEVQDTRIVDKQREGAAHQGRVVPHHEVQNFPMSLCESDEKLFHGLARCCWRSWGGRCAEGTRQRSSRSLGTNILANNHKGLNKR